MAESSSKGAVAHAKLSYTPEERTLFGRLFHECDSEGTNVVTGEAAVRMFQRSRISEQVLSEIWAMADVENRGFLVQEDFAKAMRLIGHYQAQPGVNLRPELALLPGPLPKFDGINAPTGAASAIAPQTTGIAAQHSGPIRVPPLTNDRIAEYLRLFDRAGAQNGLLAGETARTSFELSGLSSEVLAAIWNLVDTEQRGALNVTEFIIAMHLLASYKSKTLTALPPSIPPGLYEAATRRPGPQGLRSPTNANRAADLGTVPRQTSGAGSNRGPPVRQFTGPAATDWAVSAREKTSYDELFDKVDTLRQGYISGDQAVLFFTDSGLPAEILAAIWDLANIRRVDQLNRDEFAVAMHLIRNQRGKQITELPSELPANLIPPSLRQTLQSQNTGSAYPGIAPPPPPPDFHKSNADDLFGLDALTSSPPSIAPLQQDITGGSAPLNRSANQDPFASSSPPQPQQKFSARAPAPNFFKPFAPSSSFGHALAAQNTGASSGSGRGPSRQASTVDDLLGDNDPEESKKLTTDSADLANMSNQIGSLRTQMQTVQKKKGETEAQLAGNSNQKRDMEVRLQQFRAQYEQEVTSLKALEDRLAKERGEVAQLSQQISIIQTTFQEMQSRHREASTTLEAAKQENAALKDRIRQMNKYISQAQPEVERMQSELRREKGLVAINKKQAEKLEDDRSQIDKTRTDFAELRRQESARPSSRDVNAPLSATTPGGSTNPFMKRTPQASVDHAASPADLSRALSHESNKFDSIFGNTFSNPPRSSDSSAPFRGAFAQSHQQPGSSVRSSEPGMPTPTASPPQSTYQQSPVVPAQPISRQITSSDLPLTGHAADDASVATSVRAETSGSQFGFSTPTVAAPAKDATAEISRSTTQTTGAAMFERTLTSASPVTSLQSEATNKPIDHDDLFGSSVPSQLARSTTQDSSALTSEQKTNQGGLASTTAAFAGLTASDPRTGSALKSPGDPVAKFDSKFPPLQDELPAEFAAAKPKTKDEFPPIAINDEDSGSDSDVHGFDDDFTKASPQQKFDSKKQEKKIDAASPGFSNAFPSTAIAPPPPPDAPPGAFDADDFADSFAPSSKQQTDNLFGPPSAASAGQALFGSSSAGKAPVNAFNSMSSPSVTEAGRSDTYQSAASHQSGTDPYFSPTDSTTKIQGSNAKPTGSSAFDDFDHGFDDLTDAKEDDRDNDDLFFGSSHTDDHDFLPSFDSPVTTGSNTKFSQSLGRAATSNGKQVFDSDFGSGDFDSAFSSSVSKGPTSTPGQTDFGSSKSGNTGGSSSWDAMMRRLDSDDTGVKGGSGRAAAVGASSNDFGSSVLPEAPEPPKLGRAISHTTEHDDPILKKLTGMGYPRPVALAALERFDYDISKATDFLASPR